MPRLPRDLSASQVVRALEHKGFHVRRRKGSHIIMRRDAPFAQVVIPNHRRIDTGTLDVILEGADLSVEEFLESL